MANAEARDSRTDEELMVVYQSSDREAFDVLYARYAKPIYNFLRRAAPCPDAADDLLQKTFLKVHTGRHRYRPQAPFRHWIFTIARNVLRDDARQRRRRVSVDAKPFDERVSSELSEHARSDSAEVWLMVTEALSALPLTQREVIVLSRYQGMSYAEVGELLGVSENAVKQRAFQAMQNLRRSLSGIEQHVGESSG
jgi:RNA polymerase sigma-70 factor (ECF subfamily)